MVELIVLLGQVVAIICYQCRRIASCRLLNHTGEIAGLAYQGSLLVARHSHVLCVEVGHLYSSGTPQHALNTCVSVLQEGTRVAVEVNAFGRIEEHILLGVDLEQEIFQRAHAHHTGCFAGLLRCHVLEAVGGRFRSLLLHGVHQVVGIHHRALATLHLAAGKLYHAIREMSQVLAPLKAEPVKQYAQHLEVIVLLVAHHIYHFVDGEVAITQLCRAYVLSHVHRRAVFAQQQLLVEAVLLQVGPYGAILAPVHLALFQALEHQLLAFQIRLALVVYLVEAHAETFVSLIEALIYPSIHGLPQTAHLRVVLFPAHKHFAGLAHQRRLVLGLILRHALSHQVGHLGLVMLVEQYIEIANQMVALLARRLRRAAVAPFLPCQHRLADVYAAVVDNVRLHHPVAGGFQNLRQRIAQQIVAHMAQMQGFVGVWRRILHHHQRRVGSGGGEAEILVGRLFQQLSAAEGSIHGQVQEALHHIETCNNVYIPHQPLPYCLSRGLRLLLRRSQERKHHHRVITLKLLAGSARHSRFYVYIRAIESLYGLSDALCYLFFYLHFQPYFFFRYKDN